MLIGFPPIFVMDTQIIYGYNFVAPLTDVVFYNVVSCQNLFRFACLITLCVCVCVCVCLCVCVSTSIHRESFIRLD